MSTAMTTHHTDGEQRLACQIVEVTKLGHVMIDQIFKRGHRSLEVVQMAVADSQSDTQINWIDECVRECECERACRCWLAYRERALDA